MKEKAQEEKEVKISTIIFSSIIIVLSMIALLAVAIYVLNLHNPIVLKAEKILPFPAAILNNGHFVTINQLNENTGSVKHFYENQDFSQVGLRVDFTTVEGGKRLKIKEKEVLNKLIEDKAIEFLAKKNGVLITSKMVDENVKRKLDEYGNSQDGAEKSINRLYGWTIDDFKEKIVKPDMYSQELEKIFQKEDKTRDEAEKIINQAKEELKNKKDFSTVAKKYSKGATASEGGELGWFLKDQLVKELNDQAFIMKKGDVSPVIESPLGFHIINLSDKKNENGQDMVRISQIFYPKATFGEWLKDKMKEIKILVPLKDYFWNRETASAVFKDKDMQEFENQTTENSQGDASVF